MGVKPEISAYLTERAAAGLPQVWQAPLSEIRENTKQHISLQQPLIQIHSVEHLNIQGPTADLPIRIYRPTDQTNLPALIFFHGGGWVINFLDMYEPALRRISALANIVIVAVEYQKAPENPFPTALDDCFETLNWVMRNADKLSIDLGAIGIGGDSAGGNLASAIALRARDEELTPLAFQLLIYPCNDISMNYKSASDYAEGYGLTTTAMKWFWQQYLPKEEFKSNPYAVPALAENLRGTPPAIVIAAEFDPLTDDARNYHKKLIADSVPAVYREYPGQIHGFFNLGGVTDDAQTLYLDIATEINAILGRRK
jgi:acetyl esterase